mgnify:CR=1 FL=1
MNGNRIFVDTNIILYILKGKNRDLAELLQNKEVYVSFISELELLSYGEITEEDQNKIRQFLNDCIIMDVNSEIKDITIKLRRKYKIKIPDAIILATSVFLNLTFLTADKVFKRIQEYEIIILEDI